MQSSLQSSGSPKPQEVEEQNPMLKRVNRVLASGEFQTFCENQCSNEG
jgi:hypothetical protein